MTTRKRSTRAGAKKERSGATGRVRRPPRPSKGTVYDEEVIGRRFDDRRRELGMETKDVYIPMGWDKSEYTRKKNGETPCSMGEYAELHRLLKGWTGFPFVDQSIGKLFDALPSRLPELLKYLAEHPEPHSEPHPGPKE